MLDKAEQRIVNDVAKFGYHVVGISATADGPAFAYSIGVMETLNHPEIIIFGLGVETMWSIIRCMVEDIRTGRSFAEPGLYEGLVQHFACKTAPVAPKFHRDYFGFGLWYRWHIGKYDTLEAIQCFWPDKAGLFPDEDGCHFSAIQLQPRLQ